MPKTLTQEEADEHNRLYDAGWSLLRPHMLLNAAPARRRIGFFAARALRKAIALLCRAIEINPSGWQSMWAIGKAYQRLGENREALNYFMQASTIAKDHPDILREASISSMQLGDHTLAIQLAESALHLKPNDTGLVANLAMFHFRSGKADVARRLLENAMTSAPRDPALMGALEFVDNAIRSR